MSYEADTRARAATIEHEWDARALDWPNLTTDAIVVEVGGYTGRWALQMADRYLPKLFVFEPQAWAAEICRAILGDRATVLNYGLGLTTACLSMGEWGTDGCSFVKAGTEGAWMHDIGAAFRDLNIDHVDLMLMNIEGYEYRLIPYMIACGIFPRRLMVQFHDHADPDGGGIARVYEALAGAHYRQLWAYGLTLMAWERT